MYVRTYVCMTDSVIVALFVLIDVDTQSTTQATNVQVDPPTVQTATNSNGMYSYTCC